MILPLCTAASLALLPPRRPALPSYLCSYALFLVLDRLFCMTARSLIAHVPGNADFAGPRNAYNPEQSRWQPLHRVNSARTTSDAASR